MGSVDGDDQLGQVIAQMSTFTSGLGDIKRTLDAGVERLTESKQQSDEEFKDATSKEISQAVAELASLNSTLTSMGSTFGELQSASALAAAPAVGAASGPIEKQQIEVINKVPSIFLDIIRNQFRVLQTWMEPILKLSEVFAEAEDLKKAAKLTEANYKQMLEKIQRPEREVELDE